MRLNRFFLVFALIVLFLVGLLVVWQRKGPSPGVTLANFHRLHKGMTEKEVEAIMGGPGGEAGGRFSSFHWTHWKGSNCRINIMFSDWLVDGVNLRTEGVKNGHLIFDDGNVLELREEPLGFYKRMTDFFKKLLPSFA